VFDRVEEPLSVYRFHAAHKTGSGNPRRSEEICAFVETHAGAAWGAAFRDVSSNLEKLGPGLDRLKRWGFVPMETLTLSKPLQKAWGQSEGGPVATARLTA
jgi:hypothetical protein